MAVKRILIAVKTYPTISKRYDELVCTAGFLADGTWIRLYPIPFRKLDFLYEEVPREWDRGKLEALNQMKLFEKRDGDFKIVRKLPYKFSYKFEDNTGKARILMIEDWETGALFWNCIKKYNDEKIACQKVKEKYLDDFAVKKDLHFFLGTTQQYHHVYPNPFIIIGTFHPKLEEQNLFDNYV
ncbi:MAG: hypothetical protein ABIG69_06745 [Bacteroidota bacterium]